jgi:hypothetical protein
MPGTDFQVPGGNSRSQATFATKLLRQNHVRPSHDNEVTPA